MTPAPRPRTTLSTRWLAAVLAASLAAPLAVHAGDTTPAQQLQRFNAQAGSPGQAERGRVFFTSRHGGEWSCSSCHGNPPVQAGKHASTGKPIDPSAMTEAEAFRLVELGVDWIESDDPERLQKLVA